MIAKCAGLGSWLEIAQLPNERHRSGILEGSKQSSDIVTSRERTGASKRSQ